MVTRILLSLMEPCAGPHEFLLLEGPTTAGSLTLVEECNYCGTLRIERFDLLEGGSERNPLLGPA